MPRLSHACSSASLSVPLCADANFSRPTSIERETRTRATWISIEHPPHFLSRALSIGKKNHTLDDISVSTEYSHGQTISASIDRFHEIWKLPTQNHLSPRITEVASCSLRVKSPRPPLKKTRLDFRGSRRIPTFARLSFSRRFRSSHRSPAQAPRESCWTWSPPSGLRVYLPPSSHRADPA